MIDLRKIEYSSSVSDKGHGVPLLVEAGSATFLGGDIIQRPDRPRYVLPCW